MEVASSRVVGLTAMEPGLDEGGGIEGWFPPVMAQVPVCGEALLDELSYPGSEQMLNR